MKKRPVEVVETSEFVQRAAALFGADDVEALKLHLAYRPLDGVVIPESGGVRKLRWAASGRGKRGGARVIYYFHSPAMPLFVVTVYAKNAKADLTAKELAAYRKLAAALRQQFLKGSKA